jgi:hypothetical protein
MTIRSMDNSSDEPTVSVWPTSQVGQKPPLETIRVSAVNCPMSA